MHTPKYLCTNACMRKFEQDIVFLWSHTPAQTNLYAYTKISMHICMRMEVVIVPKLQILLWPYRLHGDHPILWPMFFLICMVWNLHEYRIMFRGFVSYYSMVIQLKTTAQKSTDCSWWLRRFDNALVTTNKTTFTEPDSIPVQIHR